jgi:hypothetical protein
LKGKVIVTDPREELNAREDSSSLHSLSLSLSLSQFISLQFLENEKASWKTFGEEKHLIE